MFFLKAKFQQEWNKFMCDLNHILNIHLSVKIQKCRFTIFKINIWDLFHIMKIILYVNLQCLLQTIGQNALPMLLKRGTQGHIDQFEI